MHASHERAKHRTRQSAGGRSASLADATDSPTQIPRPLDRLRVGDSSARDELATIARERLSRLARRMLGGYPGVARWEQTDDILQNAALRLCRALEEIRPLRCATSSTWLSCRSAAS
jgi:hypothetical protein